MISTSEPAGAAWFGGVLAEGVIDESTDPDLLDRGGWWAVRATFEGEIRMWRFARTRRAETPPPAPTWHGPSRTEWATSLDREAYMAGVDEIRTRVRAGEVYQVNLCRVLKAPLTTRRASPWALATRLAAGNPAPYAGVLDVPAGRTGGPVQIVSASPELLLARDGDQVATAPIKGTGLTSSQLQEKDRAENVMITDMARNDLTRICVPGTVAVPSLLATEQHPGLVHLVSTVTGRLEPGTGWREVLGAVLPPASVSGAPRSSALRAIADLEPVPRGPYCGAIGYVDADRRIAHLAVGIRTFWFDDDSLLFGTGAGITWGSDADAEWRETELKAARLVGLASSIREPAGAVGAFGQAPEDSGETAQEATA